jgi:ribosomal protein L31E
MKYLLELHRQVEAIKAGRIDDRLSEIRKFIAETMEADYQRVARTLSEAMAERDSGNHDLEQAMQRAGGAA